METFYSIKRYKNDVNENEKKENTSDRGMLELYYGKDDTGLISVTNSDRNDVNKYSYEEIEAFIKKAMDKKIIISALFVNGFFEILRVNGDSYFYDQFVFFLGNTKDDEIENVMNRILDYYEKKYGSNQRHRDKKFECLIRAILANNGDFKLLSDREDIEELRYYYKHKKSKFINEYNTKHLKKSLGIKTVAGIAAYVCTMPPTLHLLDNTGALLRIGVCAGYGSLISIITNKVYNEFIGLKFDSIINKYYRKCCDYCDDPNDFVTCLNKLIEEINGYERYREHYLMVAYELLEEYLACIRAQNEPDKKTIMKFYDSYIDLKINFRNYVDNREKHEKDSKYLEQVATKYEIKV